MKLAARRLYPERSPQHLVYFVTVQYVVRAMASPVHREELASIPEGFTQSTRDCRKDVRAKVVSHLTENNQIEAFAPRLRAKVLTFDADILQVGTTLAGTADGSRGNVGSKKPVTTRRQHRSQFSNRARGLEGTRIAIARKRPDGYLVFGALIGRGPIIPGIRVRAITLLESPGRNGRPQRGIHNKNTS
jgi:hypothetical protein